MRVPLRPVVCIAFVFLAALACARDARAVEFGPSPTASARSKMLECDSAVVMLLVETSNQVDTMPDGSTRGTGTSDVLALGSNGPEWMRRFADALLPEGREWKARMAPAGGVERADGRDQWTVRVRAYSKGELHSFWVVNLLDGWAGEGLGRPPVVFDLLGSPDSLRAVLATGMQAYPDAAKRLRNLHEPDATIMPLPERMRR